MNRCHCPQPLEYLDDDGDPVCLRCGKPTAAPVVTLEPHDPTRAIGFHSGPQRRPARGRNRPAAA